MADSAPQANNVTLKFRRKAERERSMPPAVRAKRAFDSGLITADQLKKISSGKRQRSESGS